MQKLRTYQDRVLQLMLLSVVVIFTFAFVRIELEKKAIHTEVKEAILGGLDKSELVFIEVTPANENELEWEHPDEFQYRGQLYDVVEKLEGGYWCWLDVKESVAEKKLDNLVGLILGQSSSHHNRALSLNRLFSSLYFNSADLHLPFKAAPYSLPEPPYFFQNVRNWAAAPPLPPPEYC